jgi:hypothetical protein
MENRGCCLIERPISIAKSDANQALFGWIIAIIISVVGGYLLRSPVGDSIALVLGLVVGTSINIIVIRRK